MSAARTLAAALTALSFGAAAAPACEVALVLSIDVSGSVDTKEYRLQMDGLAAALGDPTVQDALIDVNAHLAVLQWSGASRQSVTRPWAAMDTRASVDALIAALRAAPRAYRHYSTAIGDALIAAADLHGALPVACDRKVIDVSGDGTSNEGAEVTRIRDALVRGGMQINGLAIETSAPGLTDYYRRNVIGGPGAFVLTATTFEDYPRAIRRKLLREITKPVVRLDRGGAQKALPNRTMDHYIADASSGDMAINAHVINGSDPGAVPGGSTRHPVHWRAVGPKQDRRTSKGVSFRSVSHHRYRCKTYSCQ